MGTTGAPLNSTWKACKPKAGGVTIGTLYYLAKQHGWTGERPAPIIRSPAETKKAYDRHRQEVDRIETDQIRAGMVAHQMVNDAEMAEHPYLVSKGFSKRRGLVLDELLLLPIRSAYNDSLISVQTIDVEGNKRFLKGGRVSLGVMRLGSRKARERWFVEGYATALSLQAVLRYLSRDAEVVVCYSSGNLAKCARRGVVIVDHDAHICPRAPYGCGARWSEQRVWSRSVAPCVAVTRWCRRLERRRRWRRGSRTGCRLN